MKPDLTKISPNLELVLLCIREGWAKTYDALVEAFGYLPEENHTGHMTVRHCLEQLEQAHLITIDGQGGAHRNWSFHVSPDLLNIQTALGVSLRALAANPRERRMVVSPTFGRSPATERHYDVFILMPFSEALKPVYTDHIAAVLNQMSLKFARADDIFSAREVMRDIWSGISHAGLIIADCTDKNANVFYELGIAHAIGKPVILITQQSREIPFDIGQIRHIAYEYTPPGMKAFESRLRATIEEINQDPMVRFRRQLY